METPMSDHGLPPAVLAALTGATYECPDCDNDIEIRLDTHGVVHLIIRHDTTCPWLAAKEGNRR
jgi:hypothetical protein